MNKPEESSHPYASLLATCVVANHMAHPVPVPEVLQRAQQWWARTPAEEKRDLVVRACRMALLGIALVLDQEAKLHPKETRVHSQIGSLIQRFEARVFQPFAKSHIVPERQRVALRQTICTFCLALAETEQLAAQIGLEEMEIIPPELKALPVNQKTIDVFKRDFQDAFFIRHKTIETIGHDVQDALLPFCQEKDLTSWEFLISGDLLASVICYALLTSIPATDYSTASKYPTVFNNYISGARFLFNGCWSVIVQLEFATSCSQAQFVQIFQSQTVSSFFRTLRPHSIKDAINVTSHDRGTAQKDFSDLFPQLTSGFASRQANFNLIKTHELFHGHEYFLKRHFLYEIDDWLFEVEKFIRHCKQLEDGKELAAIISTHGNIFEDLPEPLIISAFYYVVENRKAIEKLRADARRLYEAGQHLRADIARFYENSGQSESTDKIFLKGKQSDFEDIRTNWQKLKAPKALYSRLEYDAFALFALLGNFKDAVEYGEAWLQKKMHPMIAHNLSLAYLDWACQLANQDEPSHQEVWQKWWAAAPHWAWVLDNKKSVIRKHWKHHGLKLGSNQASEIQQCVVKLIREWDLIGPADKYEAQWLYATFLKLFRIPFASPSLPSQFSAVLNFEPSSVLSPSTRTWVSNLRELATAYPHSPPGLYRQLSEVNCLFLSAEYPLRRILERYFPPNLNKEEFPNVWRSVFPNSMETEVENQLLNVSI